MKVRERKDPLDSKVAQIVCSYSHKLSDTEIDGLTEQIIKLVKKVKESRLGDINVKTNTIRVNADPEDNKTNQDISI